MDFHRAFPEQRIGTSPQSPDQNHRSGIPHASVIEQPLHFPFRGMDLSQSRQSIYFAHCSVSRRRSHERNCHGPAVQTTIPNHWTCFLQPHLPDDVMEIFFSSLRGKCTGPNAAFQACEFPGSRRKSAGEHTHHTKNKETTQR